MLTTLKSSFIDFSCLLKLLFRRVSILIFPSCILANDMTGLTSGDGNCEGGRGRQWCVVEEDAAKEEVHALQRGATVAVREDGNDWPTAIKKRRSRYGWRLAIVAGMRLGRAGGKRNDSTRSGSWQWWLWRCRGRRHD
ncbi:hypothetical protein B296_00021357 [Ensete ventricosum]|uniref:Uncharacterized protein n=1 Tax=Ensete ventricosum TaxID=4639 RepID=A0A426ZRH2_ENSVE|nr:hypothetical protein B296_00021357 [Ensete ventricosum]